MLTRWTPARFTGRDYLVKIWLMVAVAAARGADYLTGPDAAVTPKGGHTVKATSATVLENAVPLELWGVVLFLGAGLLAAGVIRRVHLAVWLGHTVLAIVYSVLAVSVLLSSIGHPWGDGFRGVGAFAFIAAWNWIAWARTGPTPLREDHARVTEQRGEPQ